MTTAFAVYVVSRLTSYLRPGVRSLISTHGAEKLWSVCRFSTDPMLTFFGASRKRRDLEPRVPTNVMPPQHKWCTRLDTVWKQFGNNLETIRKQFAKKNGHISKKQVETIRKPFANVRSLSPRPHRWRPDDTHLYDLRKMFFPLHLDLEVVCSPPGVSVYFAASGRTPLPSRIRSLLAAQHTLSFLYFLNRGRGGGRNRWKFSLCFARV